MREAGDTGWLFQKWISDTLGIPKTWHSFRHSFRDMLREAGVSEEIRKGTLRTRVSVYQRSVWAGVYSSLAKGGHGEGPRSPPVISMESGSGNILCPPTRQGVTLFASSFRTDWLRQIENWPKLLQL
jgi:hypothetical protein